MTDLIAAGDIPRTPAIRSARGGLSLRMLGTVLPMVLALYALFDRGFAWIHVPGIPLYSGELVVVLSIGVLLLETDQVRMGLRSRACAAFLVLFILWGLARATPQLVPYGIDAVHDSALWYYAAVALGVAGLCRARPALVEEWARRYAAFMPPMLVWLLVCPFALVYGYSLHAPDSPVSLFDHKGGNIAVQVAIALSFLWLVPIAGWRGRRVLALSVLGMLALLIAGSQNRGGLLAAAAGLAVCTMLARRRTLPALTIVGVGVMLLAAWAFDIQFARSVGRSVSVGQILQNLGSLTGGGGQGGLQETVVWRDRLWSSAISVTAERKQIVEGLGFGPNVFKEAGFTGEEIPPLRSPHNSHLDVLVRMGTVGAGMWLALWLGWYQLMLRTRARLRSAEDAVRRGLVGVCIVGVTATLINAYFDPTLESPQVAIWLWTLVGLGLGLAARRPRRVTTDQRMEPRPAVSIGRPRSPRSVSIRSR